MLLESKSLDCQRKARLALPLAEQAERLVKAMNSKRSLAENLESQIVELKARLELACAEGLEMERELDSIKARIVAAPLLPSPSAAAPVSMGSALDMVGNLAGIFPAELGTTFAECVRCKLCWRSNRETSLLHHTWLLPHLPPLVDQPQLGPQAWSLSLVCPRWAPLFPILWGPPNRPRLSPPLWGVRVLWSNWMLLQSLRRLLQFAEADLLLEQCVVLRIRRRRENRM